MGENVNQVIEGEMKVLLLTAYVSEIFIKWVVDVLTERAKRPDRREGVLSLINLPR